MNWELLGISRPSGPPPIYEEPPVSELKSDQELRERLFQGHTFEISIDLTKTYEVEQLQEPSQDELLNRFFNNLEEDII